MKPSKAALGLLLLASIATREAAARVRTLELAADESVVELRTPTEREAMIKQFEDGLKNLNPSARIRACAIAIEYTRDGIRDFSRGAVCDVFIGNTKTQLLMCDDDMVGKFTIKGGGFAIARDEVVNFTRLNCPPGG